MQACIFCLNQFDKAPKEHIIHAFLGARWKDAKLICQTCQSKFAMGIDTTISDQLQPFRLLLSIKGDHGGKGRNLTDLAVTSGETIDLGPGGEPILREPQVNVTKVTEDRYDITMKVGCERDVKWALSKVRERFPDLKLDEKAIEKLAVEKKERLEGTVSFDVIQGGKDFFRAILKCCANLFAVHDAAAKAAFLSSAFTATRQFVHDGTGAEGDFVRWMVSGNPLDLPKRGEADQGIFLSTRGGSVEGVVRFFGQLTFAVRLATAYDGPIIRCAYVVDPYREADPAEQRLKGDELAPFDDMICAFAQQSPVENAAVQVASNAALNRLMAHYVHRKNEVTVQLATDEAIRRDDLIAAMPRDAVLTMMRDLVRTRLERFEQSGDAAGISTVSINGKSDSIDPCETQECRLSAMQ